MSRASMAEAVAARREREAQREADHATLMAELARHPRHTIPCQRTPEPERSLWTSDLPDHQHAAADLCWPCAAFDACEAYARAHPGELGAFAGTTYTDRNHSRKATA